LALVDILNSFPEREAPKDISKVKGFSENLLKNLIVSILILGKVIFFVYLVEDIGWGTITFKGFLLVTAVVFPTFATFIDIMVQERLSNRYKLEGLRKKRVDRGVAILCFAILGLYFIALFGVFEIYHLGYIKHKQVVDENGLNYTTYENLLLLLALVESTMGIILGGMINRLFKKEN